MAISFTGNAIDRADRLRSDPAALEALRREGALLLKLDALLPEPGEAGGLAWTALEDVAEGLELVFLGLHEGAPAFAAVPAVDDSDPVQARSKAMGAMARLTGAELAIYGGARSLIDWHARHRFCPRCGGGTRIAKSGWQRDCTTENCNAQHFPRVDPVTIMLVEHGGRLLLGRQPSFPPGLFSALAGFIEPGESIEEAVAREVEEEAGLRVRDVTYLASQPWPFPSQLMIGCHAYAQGDELTIDHTELEEARWFSRDEVTQALAGGDEGASFTPPPRAAIARHLMEWWIDR